MRSYDPAFAYELAVIIRDGIERMYQNHEEIFYYITVYNENYAMPEMPDGVEDGIINGMYRFRQSPSSLTAERKAHLFGSGSIMVQVLQAADVLEEMGISTDIWSVTSYNELSRDGLATERANRLNREERTQSYVEQTLENEEGVFVAASDYMKAQPLSIAQWVPGRFTALGTDGYGLSESRPDLRDHFEVSAEHIVYATIAALVDDGKCTEKDLDAVAQKLNIKRDKLDSATAGPAQIRASRS
jgi:pyruvate dehydrogenase E1 component